MLFGGRRCYLQLVGPECQCWKKGWGAQEGGRNVFIASLIPAAFKPLAIISLPDFDVK